MISRKLVYYLNWINTNVILRLTFIPKRRHITCVYQSSHCGYIEDKLPWDDLQRFAKLRLENGNSIVNATAYLWTYLRENTNHFYVRYAECYGIVAKMRWNIRVSINYENYRIVLTIVLWITFSWGCHCWLQTKEACQYIFLATDCCSSRFFVWYGYLFFSDTGAFFYLIIEIHSAMFSIFGVICIISSLIAIIRYAIILFGYPVASNPLPDVTWPINYFLCCALNFSPLVSYSTSTHHYFKVILPSHQCALCHRWTKLIDRIHWYCSGTILQSARTILYP